MSLMDEASEEEVARESTTKRPDPVLSKTNKVTRPQELLNTPLTPPHGPSASQDALPPAIIQLAPPAMPRPSGQVRLDHAQRVLHPQYVTLLHALLVADVDFWCREFEEVYQAYSGWDELWAHYVAALKAGHLQDGLEKELHPGSWWMWSNFAILPNTRRWYFESIHRRDLARAFMAGEWVDVPGPLPRLQDAQAPKFYSHELKEWLTPAKWMSRTDTSSNTLLPPHANDLPDVDVLYALRLLPLLSPAPSHAYPAQPVTASSPSDISCPVRKSSTVATVEENAQRGKENEPSAPRQQRAQTSAHDRASSSSAVLASRRSRLAAPR